MSMLFIGAGTAALSVGLTAYGMVKSSEAADNAAQVDTATAAYNAKYDDSMAAQLDEDTQANVDTERQDDAVYLSRQAVSYASAGVLATTGSALDAQITTAGRFEQKIQQQWVNSNQQQEMYQSQGAVGILAGQAQASSDRMSGSIAMINGGASIAGSLLKDEQSGVFNFGSTPDPDLPSNP
jgi:hypothetical protein